MVWLVNMVSIVLIVTVKFDYLDKFGPLIPLPPPADYSPLMWERLPAERIKWSIVNRFDFPNKFLLNNSQHFSGFGCRCGLPSDLTCDIDQGFDELAVGGCTLTIGQVEGIFQTGPDIAAEFEAAPM